MTYEDDMRDIDDTIQRMRMLETDHTPDSWPAVQMRDITALLDDSESWQRQLSDRTDDVLQFVAERDAALAENAKLRQALDSEPNEPAIIDSCGWLKYRQGEVAEAEKEITRNQIEVMQAFIDGKQIQYRTIGICETGPWLRCRMPAWNWSKCEYRVKPEKERYYCVADMDKETGKFEVLEAYTPDEFRNLVSIGEL